MKQAGTGPNRRHIQGSKRAKGLPSVNLQYSKIEKPKKVDRVARRDPLTRAPGALKGVDTSEIVNIFVAVEGGALGRKKSHNAEKQNGDPSGFLNTHSVAKYQRN